MTFGEDQSAATSVHHITPLDIHNKEFSRSFRGYNEDEVDEFLDLVVAEFESLIRTNEELQSEISGLESRIEHYKGLEETLKNAIVLAQKTADEIKSAAARECEAMKHEASLEAQKVKDEASEILRKSYQETEAERNRLLRFKAEFKAFLQSNLELLEKSADGLLKRLDEGKPEDGGAQDF